MNRTSTTQVAVREVHRPHPRYLPRGLREFKDEYSGAEILDDPPYEIRGRTRKGGFFAAASARLDPGTL